MKFGDYVVYLPNNKVGRVTEVRGDKAFVCYTDGCTAAGTPLELIREATESEIRGADPLIGFHRFDKYCPNRVDEACYMCKAERW